MRTVYFWSLMALPFYLWPQNEIDIAFGDEELMANVEETSEVLVTNSANKLNLNTADVTQLESIDGISPHLAHRIVQKRTKFGPYLSLYELQRVEGISKDLLVKLDRHLRVHEESIDQIKPIGRSYFRMRSITPLNTNTNILNRSRFILKSKLQFKSRIAAGFVLERDAQEAWWNTKRDIGPDYINFFLEFNKPCTIVNNIILGDLSVRFGQGLLVNNQFRKSNTGSGHYAKYTGAKLRPFRSMNENLGLRGVGISLASILKIQTDVFVSYTSRDGRQSMFDSKAERFVYSLSSSGKHISPTEIKARDAIKELVTGLTMNRKLAIGEFGINVLLLHYDLPIRPSSTLIIRREQPWKEAGGVSLDYNLFWKNINAYGEWAVHRNKSLAITHNFLVSLSSRLQLHLNLHSFSPLYVQPLAQSFGRFSTPTNEDGVYVSALLNLSHSYSLYFSLHEWRRLWLSHLTDGTRYGRRIQLSLRAHKRKHYSWYTSINVDRADHFSLHQEKRTKSRILLTSFKWRNHLSIKLSKSLELRTRMEMNTSSLSIKSLELGYSFFQDVIYKPMESPFSFTARIAHFDTPAFEQRIYSFENSLSHVFSIPFYYGRGQRYYINVKYKIDDWAVEIRWASTLYDDFSRDKHSLSDKQEIQCQLTCNF